MKIDAVLVRKPGDDVFWKCQPLQDRFKCGVCHRGNISPQPKKGEKCRVCKAVVAQVVTDKDFVFDNRLRPVTF